MEQRVQGDLKVGGAGGGNVIVDVASVPTGTGFKFNTLPFGGMTIEGGNAVRVSSFSEIQLAPATDKAVVLATFGALPTASASLRGALFVVRGGAGAADTLQVCLKAAAGSYSWKTIATG